MRKKEQTKFPVLILGGGPAGLGLAIWLKRMGVEAAIIEKSNQIGGQLHEIDDEIIDYPGFLASNGQKINNEFLKQIEKLNLEIFLNQKISFIDSNQQKIATRDFVICYQFLVIATGQHLRWLETLKPYPDFCFFRSSLLLKTNPANQSSIVFIGGGDNAFTEALNLAKYDYSITIFHRRETFRARQELIKKAKEKSNIQIFTPYVLSDVLKNQNELKLTFQNQKNGTQKTINTSFVFLCLGRKPNSSLGLENLLCNNQGYILVDQKFETSLKNIYAIGEVNAPVKPSLADCAGQAANLAQILLEKIQNTEETSCSTDPT